MRMAMSPSASMRLRPNLISVRALENSRLLGSGDSWATASTAWSREYPARSEVAVRVRVSGS